MAQRNASPVAVEKFFDGTGVEIYEYFSGVVLTLINEEENGYRYELTILAERDKLIVRKERLPS